MSARAFLARVGMALAVPLFLSNCMTDASPSPTAMAATQPEPNGSVLGAAQPAPNGQALALAGSNTVAADYQISPRDIIEVSVFQVPDLTKNVQVSDDGTISLPLIGKTAIRGKTTIEAEQIIGDKLRATYMQSPQVSVFVKQYGQRVTISGEVKTPRVLNIDGRVTLTEAIASTGGFSDVADPQRVHIARSANQHIHDEVFDFGAIQGGRIPDPMLQGGDLIVVEQSGVKVAFKSLKDLLPFAILAPLL